MAHRGGHGSPRCAGFLSSRRAPRRRDPTRRPPRRRARRTHDTPRRPVRRSVRSADAFRGRSQSAWLRARVAADVSGSALVTGCIDGCAAQGPGDARRVGGGPPTVAVGTGDLTGQPTGAVVRHANRRVVRGCRVRGAMIDRRPPRGIRRRWGSRGSPIRRGLQRRSHARRQRLTTRVRMPLRLGDMGLRAYHPDMTVRMKTPCT